MFPLIKEIKSKDGVVHFRRYLLLSTKWFHCYIHKIYQPDKDIHLHNHPWNFWGIILWGGYLEENQKGIRIRKIGSWGGGNQQYFHKIKEIISPTTSLFFVSTKTNDWGYQTSQGYLDHQKYRELKNLNKLPS